MITKRPVRDTQLLTVSVESADHGFSATVANAILLIFSDQLQETQSTRFASSKDSLKTQMTDAESQVAGLRSSIINTKDLTESARLETCLNQYE